MKKFVDRHPFISVILMVAIIGCYAWGTGRLASPPPTRAASQFANILCDNFVAVPTTAANLQIITAGNANMFIYICSYNLDSSAAITFSIVEGTGTTCATNTAAMVGGSTAATGMSLATGTPINYGGGTGAVVKTKVAGDNVCIFPSAGNIAGVVGWTTASF